MRIKSVLVSVVVVAAASAAAFGQLSAYNMGPRPADVSGNGGGVRINEYQRDDGIAENSVGLTNGGAFAWMQRYVVQPGLDTITGIRVAFGTPVALNGQTVVAHFWSDPNGDGNPTDAQSLSSVAGVIAGANASVPINTPTFVFFDIPDVTRTVGSNFFVGIVMQNQLAAQFPAAVDQTLPLPGPGIQWAAFGAAGSLNPNALSNVTDINSITGLGGDWLIRADAVPEPTTLALLGLGGLLLRRRR